MYATLNLSDLLASDGYFLYNKRIGRELGFDCAVLLGEMYNKYSYYKSENKLVDGMFYLVREQIEYDTGMNAHAQRVATDKLKKAGIISISRKGVPSKNYYRIHEDELIKLFQSQENQQLSKICTTRDSQNERLDIQNVNAINNNTITKEINNNEINRKSYDLAELVSKAYKKFPSEDYSESFVTDSISYYVEMAKQYGVEKEYSQAYVDDVVRNMITVLESTECIYAPMDENTMHDVIENFFYSRENAKNGSTFTLKQLFNERMLTPIIMKSYDCENEIQGFLES